MDPEGARGFTTITYVDNMRQITKITEHCNLRLKSSPNCYELFSSPASASRLDKPRRPTEGTPMEPAFRILAHAHSLPGEPADLPKAAGVGG